MIRLAIIDPNKILGDNRKMKINEDDPNAIKSFWRYVEWEDGPLGYYYKCDYCGYDTGETKPPRTCPNCGADMS